MRRLDGRTLACLQKTGAALACMHLRVAALRLVVRGCAARDLHAVLECAGACDLLHVLAGGDLWNWNSVTLLQLSAS